MSDGSVAQETLLARQAQEQSQHTKSESGTPGNADAG